MQRFLIVLFLVCTNVLNTFGQTDTIPKWQELQTAEAERLSQNSYEEYGSISMGAKVSYTSLQDRLMSPLLYSGFLYGGEFEGQVIVPSSRASLFANAHYGRLKSSTLSNVTTFGDIAGSAIETSELHIRLSVERKFNSLPHFLGGFLSVDLKQRYRKKDSSLNYIGYTGGTYTHTAIGLSYLYRTHISNTLVRTLFTLPLLNHSTHMGWMTGFNPTRFFAPTLRTEVLLPTKKNNLIRLFYSWKFGAIKGTPNKIYNYRYNINSIGVTFMEMDYDL